MKTSSATESVKHPSTNATLPACLLCYENVTELMSSFNAKDK